MNTNILDWIQIFFLIYHIFFIEYKYFFIEYKYIFLDIYFSLNINIFSWNRNIFYWIQIFFLKYFSLLFMKCKCGLMNINLFSKMSNIMSNIFHFSLNIYVFSLNIKYIFATNKQPYLYLPIRVQFKNFVKSHLINSHMYWILFIDLILLGWPYLTLYNWKGYF